MNYSLEVIDHQINSSFGKELEEELSRFRLHPKITDGLFKDNVLANIVNKHTNLKINVVLEGNSELHVFSPNISKGNVVLDDWRQKIFINKDTNDFLKNNDFIEGGVDLKNAKVFGDFTQFVANIHIGSELLSSYSPLTVEELTAGFIHEVGHVFVYLEMLGRLTRTSYLLSEGTQQLLNAKNKEQRIKIFDKLENYAKINIPDKEKLAHGQLDANGYRIIILDVMQKKSIEELEINVYSSRSWEQLADNFTARFGYGRALVLGLDKLHRANPSGEYNHPIMQTILLIIITLLVIISIYGLALMLFLCLFINPYEVDYDPPKKRFEKMKLQINNAIKNKNLSKSQQLQLIKDYDKIKNVLDHIYNNIDVFTVFFAAFRPFKTIKMLDIINTQERLEKLQNNDLFTAAARISVLK